MDETLQWQSCVIWTKLDDQPRTGREAATQTRVRIFGSHALLHCWRIELAVDSNCGGSWPQHDPRLDLCLSFLFCPSSCECARAFGALSAGRRPVRLDT